MAKEKDFSELAKEKYEGLLKEIETRNSEIAGLEKEAKSLRAYLQSVGLIESPKRRGRKPRETKTE